MRSLCTRWVTVVSMSLPLIACGASPDTGAFGSDDPDGSTTTDGGGTDTTSSGDTTPGVDTGSPPVDTGLPPSDTRPPPTDTTPPPPTLTLDNVCEKLAGAICSTTTKNCCTSKGVKFDEGGCRTGVLAYCGALVDEVKAGDRTFDASKFDGCAAAWRTLTTTCSVPVLDYVKTYGVCEELLNGSIKPGSGTCTLESDCNVAPAALASCSSTTATCINLVIVGKDAPCNYDGSTRRLCDYGLYCPFTGVPSTCKAARPSGSSCSGGSDPSCGWGNRCDGSNHCAPGLPMGSSCGGDLQCASWGCSGSRCTDPNVQMAIPSTCSGV